jgi:hypothetical protein
MANPRVEIRLVQRYASTYGYALWCLVEGCTFAEHVFVKTDAQTIQRAHARGHRMRRQERKALNQEPRDV